MVDGLYQQSKVTANHSTLELLPVLHDDNEDVAAQDYLATAITEGIDRVIHHLLPFLSHRCGLSVLLSCVVFLGVISCRPFP